MLKAKLTKFQKETLIAIGENDFGKNFYWTGGTLLSSHYLYHRHSVDLDFFSDDLFQDDQYLLFINELKKKVKANKVSVIIKNNRRIYLIKRKKEEVKLELVFFPFLSIEKRVLLKEFSIKVDSLSDIMTNKILSTYQRNEVKDIYDLYCYFKKNPKYNLAELIDLAEKKFGVAVEPVLLLAKINKLASQLDSLQPLLFSTQKNLAHNVKDFFQDIFNSIARGNIK